MICPRILFQHDFHVLGCFFVVVVAVAVVVIFKEGLG